MKIGSADEWWKALMAKAKCAASFLVSKLSLITQVEFVKRKKKDAPNKRDERPACFTFFFFFFFAASWSKAKYDERAVKAIAVDEWSDDIRPDSEQTTALVGDAHVISRPGQK